MWRKRIGILFLLRRRDGYIPGNVKLDLCAASMAEVTIQKRGKLSPATILFQSVS